MQGLYDVHVDLISIKSSWQVAHCDMACKDGIKTVNSKQFFNPLTQTETLEPSTKRPRVDVQNEVEHHKLSCKPLD